jgi:NAD(P)-dependent dehydrogenase (short-subunit alcohol dehydrogenase family)
MSMTTDQKTFVITGITRGLGLALTRQLLNRGHCVHGCGRGSDPLAAVEDVDTERYEFRRLDVTDRESVSRWAANVSAEEPCIDYLIHNAAVIHTNARLWEIDPGELDAVIDVNIKGTFTVLQAFLPVMLKQRHGIILTLSSGAGRQGLPEISAYCASKWAVEGLTKSLAAELPADMAAIPLSPGIVDTDMLRSTFGDKAAGHQKTDTWAKIAADYILSLKTSQSGQSLTVP